MENFENPADGIEFKDNVAARRDQVRADLDVQFSDAGAPAGAIGKPLPFTFRVADYTRPQQDGGGIEFVDFPKTLAGGAIKGAGSAVRGVGKVAEGLGRVGVTAVNQAFDAGLEIPTNPLEERRMQRIAWANACWTRARKRRSAVRPTRNRAATWTSRKLGRWAVTRQHRAWPCRR